MPVGAGPTNRFRIKHPMTSDWIGNLVIALS